MTPITILSLLLLPTGAVATPTAAPDFDSLIAAIAQVESGGDPNAYNAREDAVGILQIRPILVRDCNRILGEDRFALADRTDRAKSEEMFRVIAEHYSKGQSYEVIARRWNGGPRGETKQATAAYWQRVEAALNK